MPPGFNDEWRLIKELRKDRTAVVDTMGCERLADPQASEKDRRYHVLVSLMLSSQTKDTVNAAVMGALKARGLSVKRILDETTEDELHELIKPVGFHNVKTKNIRRATQILRDEYDEDVPNTMEALLALPGVGPKMALLVLKCAFDITAGISVDTHVHRISNQLGWTGGQPTLDKGEFPCKEPEKTRKALEQWVPRNDWGDVNWLLVGLGQEVQTEKPKLLRKALDSSDPAYAVAFLGRIGMDCAKVAKAEGLELVT
jgi:endonuclease-3